jgi:hypothetical protein
MRISSNIHALISLRCKPHNLYSKPATNFSTSWLQTYKQKAIHFYDPHKAPLLDHYRFVHATIGSGSI